MEIFKQKRTEKEHGTRQKIVWKIGTRSICSENGTVHMEVLDSYAEQVKTLQERGIDSVFVSSAAVAFGDMAAPHIQDRKTKAFIGQPYLMLTWMKAFQKQDLTVAQLLYSEEELKDRERLKSDIDGLLAEQIIPVINCTDPDVSNDWTGAQVAGALEADLNLLTNTQGVLRDGESIPVVSGRHEIEDALGGTSNGGTGGMGEKVEVAVEHVRATRRNAAIAYAHDERILTRMALGEAFTGTVVQV